MAYTRQQRVRHMIMGITTSPNLQTVTFNIVTMTLGAVLGALGFIIFMAPFNIAISGLSGIALILEELFGWPIGVMSFLLNLPLLYMGYKMLPGGWQVIASTLWVVTVYSVALELLPILLVDVVLSDDALLNAMFGGVLLGVGAGLVYRSGTTFGGTSILARILQRRTGMPMSTTQLYIDATVLTAVGLVFGWEAVLYALVVLFISGVATDYVMEGPSVIRTATIITNEPQAVSEAIMVHLVRGVTAWEGIGMYTGSQRSVLFVTISRAQVADLKQVVTDVDDKALIVIGQAHTAYGSSFRPLGSKRPF